MLLFKGLTRLKMHRVKQAVPITPHVLSCIFPFFYFSSTLHMACWSAYLISFFIFARKSNMVPSSLGSFDPSKQLCVRNILVGDAGLLITLKWSKTNQLGKRAVQIPVPKIPGSVLCPWSAYTSLRRVVKASELDPRQFLDKMGRLRPNCHLLQPLHSKCTWQKT